MLTCKPEEIQGVNVTRLVNYSDDRGVLRKISPATFLGDDPTTVLISSNKKAGAIRGFHFQVHPFAEKKVITCLRGSVFDAIIDIRPNSPTFMKIATLELTDENMLELSLPIGVAHGFQTLSDNTILHYTLTSTYSASHAVAINPLSEFKDLWPLAQITLGERDILGLNLEEAVVKFTKSQQIQNL